MIKKKLVILFIYAFLEMVMHNSMFGQAPPPPPGGPGSGDPPIGGTVPVDDGLIFLLIMAVIFAGVKLYQTRANVRLSTEKS